MHHIKNNFATHWLCRLSENKQITVAVLESGSNADDQFVIRAPGMYDQDVGSPLCPVMPTVPQEGMNNRQLTLGTGRLLGDGSAVNGLVWARGGLKDYGAWEELGNPRCNGKEMFKYFKKAENYTPPSLAQIEIGATALKSVHGVGGPINVSFSTYKYDQTRYWNASLKAVGLDSVPDILNGSLHGYSTVLSILNPKTARRADAYTDYIAPNVERKNLFVLANHTVSRVEFNAQKAGGLLATSVEWYPIGDKTRKQIVKAHEEVVLSAGALGSPKLLELPGIGDKNILASAGVKSLLDLPSVRTNMQDHVHAVAVSTTNIAGYTSDSIFANTTLAKQMREEYDTKKTGIYAATLNNLGYPSPSLLFKDTAAVSGKAFAAKIRASMSQYAKYYVSTNSTNVQLIKKQYEIVASRYEENYMSPVEIKLTPGYSGTGKADTKNLKYQTVNHVLIAPLSRGHTHIGSSDVEDPVTINPQYYSYPLDVEVHVASLKLARKILDAPNGLGQWNTGETEPGKQVSSDEDMKKWLSNNVRSDWNPVGTCAMLPKELGGVVDSKLRIYGTANLRVVDTSIIPLEIPSHLMQPVYGVAEKAADIIKNAGSSKSYH
ncbi:alcohol oxidase [Gilbertella persicaria]|uniref:alcohol oxidase n=1 Tax=Gilbertella persicaria TaxID=101096 RepID=UPI00221F9D13|nr:alcohol oxidase [Gilbertella persicaria]KAI8059416.1 alcohol oxidase [Gilbertella persicaria]